MFNVWRKAQIDDLYYHGLIIPYSMVIRLKYIIDECCLTQSILALQNVNANDKSSMDEADPQLNAWHQTVKISDNKPLLGVILEGEHRSIRDNLHSKSPI